MFNFNNIEKILLDEVFIKDISKNTDYEYDSLRNYIVTSLEEASHTLSLISKYDLSDKKILEFGSGLGIASIVLNSNGYNITSFEPGGLGFEKNILVNKYIKEHLNLEFNLVSDIECIKDNSFNLIFSNNVLEHIDNIEEVIYKLDSSLTKNGIMIHNVPNYIFPYEPHFGIFFFPIFPKKMSILISTKITNTDLWESINFINVFDIKSYAKKANAIVKFEKELMYKAINRIEVDKEFSKRHIKISKIVRVLRKIGVMNLVKILPIALNTPMIFEWRKNDR